MAKQKVLQRFIFKISTDRLKKAKWDLTLSLRDARRNSEIVSLSDSQMLRWIDELNGVDGAETKARDLRRQIKAYQKQPPSTSVKKRLQYLYEELDKLQFKPDYMYLMISNIKDYYKACEGFKINGIKYVRLLGTNGGVKNSTIVFVSERLAPILRERIDNGRDKSVPQVPAKFEAYRALTCSGSIPVSMPRGVLLVDDCVTHFREDVILLSDNEDPEGDPVMREVPDFDIELDESDGYGLILPSLAERWSQELGLRYTASGVNSRWSFTKGMLFTFDFIRFADEVAGSYMVRDAWGDEVDIRNVEAIFTTSMIKLWKCYKSMDDYLANCEKNHYTIAIAKTAPMELEDHHTLNYQFIQSYKLTDEDIDELIAPTLSEIDDILTGDYRKMLLYLRGTHMSEEYTNIDDSTFLSALMVDKEMFNDPYVKSRTLQMISRRISDAKIGVLGVHGNYSIVCGDPYALMQSIFGLPVTGLLGKGEIYNKYWLDSGADELVCFRAPMSCHANIRKVRVSKKEAVREWFKYMNTVTAFNAWDSAAAALNGMDKDGDLVMLTDNPVLLRKHVPMKTIFCQQKTAEKKIITEDDLIASNINGFGDEIGKTTNWITSMYDVQSQYDPDSEEYKTLEYRIIAGQHLQQACIDKTKGIVFRPMPKKWRDWFANKLDDTATPDEHKERNFNISILADKKPYFMIYIYPGIKREYDRYYKAVDEKCRFKYRIGIEELLALPEDELTESMRTTIKYYRKKMPVGIHDCVMNRICRKVEERFNDHTRILHAASFDYTIMKSGCDISALIRYKDEIERLYREHNDRLREYKMARVLGRDDDDMSWSVKRFALRDYFARECSELCSNSEVICDALLDLCYKKEGTKQFVWDICGEQIIENLLKKNDHIISFPVRDDNGDIEFRNQRFRMVSKKVGDEGDGSYFE